MITIDGSKLLSDENIPVTGIDVSNHMIIYFFYMISIYIHRQDIPIHNNQFVYHF